MALVFTHLHDQMNYLLLRERIGVIKVVFSHSFFEFWIGKRTSSVFINFCPKMPCLFNIQIRSRTMFPILPNPINDRVQFTPHSSTVLRRSLFHFLLLSSSFFFFSSSSFFILF